MIMSASEKRKENIAKLEKLAQEVLQLTIKKYT